MCEYPSVYFVEILQGSWFEKWKYPIPASSSTTSMVHYSILIKFWRCKVELFVYFAIVGIYSPRFEMAGHPQRSRHKNNGKMREILQLFIQLMACILCKPHKRKFYCYEIEGECVSCWGFRFWLLLLWCDQRKFCTAADFRKWKRSFGKNSENAPIIHRAAPIELETVEEILQNSVGK